MPRGGDVLGWLEAVQGNSPSSKHLFLFLRHSIREEIPAGRLGFQASLTDAGIKLAQRFGERIKRPIANIVSSPVARCLETGRAIQRGYGASVPTITSSLLTEPGAFVLSCEKAGDLMYEHKGLDMVNLLLGGRRPRGLRKLKEGCQFLIHLLREMPAEPGHLSLLVSHDTVLAPFVYGLLARRSIRQEDWPEFLESCGISLGQRSLRLFWRNQMSIIPLNQGRVKGNSIQAYR